MSGRAAVTSLREIWDAQAAEWIRCARTPGHDHANERLNIPRFLELLPPAEAARERHEAIVADAASLSFEGASIDLVLAFMSLHDMDEPGAAVREGARVLQPDGRRAVKP